MLNPKSSKEIIAKVSEQLGISESKVDAVVNSFYKEVRKSLSSPEHINVYVEKLGYFKLKSKSLANRLSKIANIKAKYEKRSNTETVLRGLKEFLEEEAVLKNAQKYFNNEKNKKLIVKAERYRELGNDSFESIDKSSYKK